MTNNIYNVFPGIAKTATGTTTNNFADSLVPIDSLGYDKLTIIISNTGALNGLSYTIDGYGYDGGVLFSLVSSTNIAASSNAKYAMAANETYAKIVVSVKSQVAGSSTTYQVDYTLLG